MSPARSDEEIRAAVEALSDPGRFRRAETVVAAAAPQLQQVLAAALEAGGWFSETHEDEVRKASELPEPAERLAAIRTLLAEEARMGMMVGVAVGWALVEELGENDSETNEMEA